jgi:hypothetical protein
MAMMLMGCALIRGDTNPAVQLEAPPDAPYRVGVAKVEVTPDHPMGEWGGAHNRMVDTAYQSLYVRTMAISDGATPVVIVSGEILYWDRDVVEMARQRLSARYDLGSEQILMVATHTHNGPSYSRDDAYKQTLLNAIEQTVGEALAMAKPAALRFGRSECYNSVNRRRLKKNGFVAWGINPYGVTDPEVIAVTAVGADGKPIGVLTNYACHPTTVRNQGFGGDFVGWAMQDIERRTGAITLYLQGCAGEMKVRNAREDNPYGFTFEGGPQKVAEFGRELSDATLEAMVYSCERITGSIDVRLGEAALPLMESRIEETGETPFEGPERRWARMARLMLNAMDENGNYERTRQCEVYVVAIGDDYRHVGLNGEPCVGIQRRIKMQLEGKPVMVSGYTGPSIGYFPSYDELVQLGYEVKIPYSPEAEDFLMAKVMELVK